MEESEGLHSDEEDGAEPSAPAPSIDDDESRARVRHFLLDGADEALALPDDPEMRYFFFWLSPEDTAEIGPIKPLHEDLLAISEAASDVPAYVDLQRCFDGNRKVKEPVTLQTLLSIDRILRSEEFEDSDRAADFARIGLDDGLPADSVTASLRCVSSHEMRQVRSKIQAPDSLYDEFMNGYGDDRCSLSGSDIMRNLIEHNRSGNSISKGKALRISTKMAVKLHADLVAIASELNTEDRLASMEAFFPLKLRHVLEIPKRSKRPGRQRTETFEYDISEKPRSNRVVLPKHGNII